MIVHKASNQNERVFLYANRLINTRIMKVYWLYSGRPGPFVSACWLWFVVLCVLFWRANNGWFLSSADFDQKTCDFEIKFNNIQYPRNVF